jgi:hypothetical protein
MNLRDDGLAEGNLRHWAEINHASRESQALSVMVDYDL